MKLKNVVFKVSKCILLSKNKSIWHILEKSGCLSNSFKSDY